MRIYVRVADLGSFTKAAEHLDMSIPMVTRAISALEAHLNVRLLNRTTRRVTPSEAGIAYLEGCRALLTHFDELEASTAKIANSMSGAIRIVASTSVGIALLAPVLASYQQLYPNVELNLTLLDRPTDIIADGFDVGIVTENMVNSETIVMRSLRRTTSIIVASPAYLAERGIPKSPGDLENHVFLANDATGRSFKFSDGVHHRQINLPVPALTVNNILMLHRAALAGMGFAILPVSVLDTDLANGHLVRVASPWIVEDADVSSVIVYPNRRYLGPKLRSFVEHVVSAFAPAEGTTPH